MGQPQLLRLLGFCNQAEMPSRVPPQQPQNRRLLGTRATAAGSVFTGVMVSLAARPKPVHHAERDARVIVTMIEEVRTQQIDLRASAEMLGEKVIAASAQNP